MPIHQAYEIWYYLSICPPVLMTLFTPHKTQAIKIAKIPDKDSELMAEVKRQQVYQIITKKTMSSG